MCVRFIQDFDFGKIASTGNNLLFVVLALTISEPMGTVVCYTTNKRYIFYCSLLHLVDFVNNDLRSTPLATYYRTTVLLLVSRSTLS